MKNPEKYTIITKTINYVQTSLYGAEGGHDWWHVVRVRNLSMHIAKHEKSDLFIVELGALLHDIADSKFNNGDEDAGPFKAQRFLQSIGLDEESVLHIKKIIENVSFKGGREPQTFHSPELEVVQDADRLDAIGAVGIARAFNYGGFKNREMYNPAISPNLNMTKEEYKNSTAPTINHFYEKLLLLKGRMNTDTGRKLAEHRHRYMENFLSEFYSEWDGGL